jgi:ADP-ribose pyrophosphatase YjhB (NUDIX family)
MIATGAGPGDTVPILDIFQTEVGYATPKIGVRAAVFDRERILLVRERKDGLWTVPGGWVDVGDAPSVAAIREVKQESVEEANLPPLSLSRITPVQVKHMVDHHRNPEWPTSFD